MSKVFLQKGYPKKIIEEAIEKVTSMDRDSLLEPKPPKNDNEEIPLVLVTTYQPNFGGLQEICKKNWELLARSTSTRTLSDKRVIFGYRRPPNLRDLLVRAKLDTKPEKPRVKTKRSYPPCDRDDCRYCTRMDKSGKIYCDYTKREYVARMKVNCKCDNLIYCITCTRCLKQYVGQSQNTLSERFKGHFAAILYHPEKTEVSRHFNQPDHKGLDDVKIHIVDFIYLNGNTTEGLYIRNHIEMNWIHRLHSQFPMGMNAMEKPPKINPRYPKGWIKRRR